MTESIKPPKGEPKQIFKRPEHIESYKRGIEKKEGYYGQIWRNAWVQTLDKWEERKLVGKVLSINDIKFKVIKEIPRCSATNIKPKTSDINLNIPLNLKKIYNHINLGIYLDPLNDGKINKGDLIKINE